MCLLFQNSCLIIWKKLKDSLTFSGVPLLTSVDTILGWQNTFFICLNSSFGTAFIQAKVLVQISNKYALLVQLIQTKWSVSLLPLLEKFWGSMSCPSIHQRLRTLQTIPFCLCLSQASPKVVPGTEPFYLIPSTTLWCQDPGVHNSATILTVLFTFSLQTTLFIYCNLRRNMQSLRKFSMPCIFQIHIAQNEQSFVST